MDMQIRIAAKDDFISEFARAFVGATRTDGPHPKFVFKNAVQRAEYDRIRRGLELEHERNGVVGKGGQTSETTGDGPGKRVGRNCIQNNRRFYRSRTI